MLLLILGFFGVIVAVNATMAVVASASWTGLVVENSYVASQQFEAKRLAHVEQQAAGWQAALTYTPGTARLVVRDADGRPVDLGEVTILINRPVGGHDDRRLTLARQGDGSYAAAVELPRGVWEALVTAPATPKGPFELHSRFSVREDAP
ncbi:MAG TPA: cytochrome oxidase [Alphaproteobacteria bacterium]|nr:cytochrome oxidase [Alphaproteobacteria bacterium]